MGGWFGRRGKDRSAPGPLPLPAGECQFVDAWRFAVPETERFPVVADRHEGALRAVWFRPVVPGPPFAYTICGAHATVFVRYTMIHGRSVTVR